MINEEDRIDLLNKLAQLRSAVDDIKDQLSEVHYKIMTCEVLLCK